MVPAPPPDPPVCPGCTLVAVAAPVAAGAFVLAHERRRHRAALVRHKPRIPPRPLGARAMQLVGWSFIGLGVARAAS